MRRDFSTLPDPAAPGEFPTLDADLGEDAGAGPGPARRICIATPEVPGPHGGTGIANACHHLARCLAGWGHDVVVAHASPDARRARVMARAGDAHARLGIAFEPIVPRSRAVTPLGRVSAPTWTLLEWLRERAPAFDVVYFPDRYGLGYGPLLAKSQGTALGATHLVVLAREPTLRPVEAGRAFFSAEHELGWVFMERRSVELADTVVSPGAQLLQWMRDAGYALPERSFVWPDPLPAAVLEEAAAGRAARDGAALEEVVYFGPLDPRAGLELFIDAVERLVRRGRAPARVSFLGDASGGADGLRIVRRSTRDWPVEVRTLTGLGTGAALAHLARPGRLAVVPSLHDDGAGEAAQCLRAGIPVLAAATAGTLALVAPEDRARVLAAPDHVSLGERIAHFGCAPLRVPRPGRDLLRSLEVWERWHAQGARFRASAARFEARARRADAETPPVTVCIVHHERPRLLRMAVDSVLAQDYPAVEAVLVDDGSEGAETAAALDALETGFAGRGWRVIRQENRYVGAARNAAAAAARGEWLLFLDDDNVLFPEAVSRLVRAARFSGADCVTATAIRFSGDGDPRTDAKSHGAPIRFLGGAAGWSRLANVVGDACALVRREAFEAAGGFTEEYRVGLEDLSFFNRLLRAGYRIEPVPEPVYYYRIAARSIKGRNRESEAARLRMIGPWIEGLPAEDRAFLSYATAHVGRPEARAARLLAWMLMRFGRWMRRLPAGWRRRG